MIDKRISVGALSMASVLIAGCGSSNSGVLPLSTAQRGEVINTLNSAANPVSAGIQQGLQTNKASATNALMQSAAVSSLLRPFLGAADQVPGKDVRTTMRNRLADTAECTSSIQGVADAQNLINAYQNSESPSELSALLQKGIDLKIAYSGVNCPATFASEITFSDDLVPGSNTSTAKASMSLDYVGGQEFKSMNDVSEVHFKVSMNSVVTANSTSGDMTMNATVNLSGSIVSQQYGNIPFSGQATFTDSGYAANMSMTFPGFTANLTSTSGDSGKLLLNGQDIANSLPQ